MIRFRVRIPGPPGGRRSRRVATLAAMAVILCNGPGAPEASADAGAAERGVRDRGAQDRRTTLPAPDSVFRGRVVEAGSDRPVFSATVLLMDASGSRRAGGFTSSDGTFRLSVPGQPGDEVRVERLGYVTLVHALDGNVASVRQVVELRMERRPVEFSAIEVTAEARCDMAPSDAGRTYALWEATRIALQAAELTESEALARYRTRVWQHRENDDGTQVQGRTTSVQVTVGHPFGTLSPSVLAEQGYVRETDGGHRLVHGPDAGVLLSDAFASSHCFRVVESTGAEGEESDETWVGLAFEPAPDPASIVRIGGTLWLDSASGELRVVDFRFMWFEPRRRVWATWGADSGGTIRYRALDDGRWVVEAWSLRALSALATSGHWFDVAGDRRALPGALSAGLWYDVAGGRLLEVLDGEPPQ